MLASLWMGRETRPDIRFWRDWCRALFLLQLSFLRKIPMPTGPWFQSE
jgi:hypothetical protein